MKNRRLFLKSLSSLPLLFGFNQITQAKTKKALLLNQFSIAGFQFYQGRDIIRQIKPGDELFIKAEPDNDYDQYAVEIYYKNNKLGYIPKNENKTIRNILHSDVKLYATVDKVNAGKRAWDAVQVSVFMVV